MNSLLGVPPATGCISDLKLDRWRAGELSSEGGAELQHHLITCARCREREQSLAQQAQAFLQQFPEAPRAPAQRPFARRWAMGGGLLAAAAVLLLAVGLQPGSDGSTRSKGSARLGFYLQRQGSVVLGHDGYRVHPGDQLRFTLTLAEPRHVAILGRDDGGGAFVYHPTAQRGSALMAAGAQTLDSSIELDGALGTELVLGVFCDQPFELEPLRGKLAVGFPLPELPGCSVDALRLEKVTGP